MSTTKPCKVPGMSLQVTLSLAPSSAMFRVQRGMMGSQALPVSEAQWLKPLGAGGSATKSRLAQAVVRVLGRHCGLLVSGSALKRRLRPSPLGFYFSEPTQTL